MAERLRVGRITGLEGVPADTDSDGNPVEQYGLWINDGGIVVVNDADVVIIDGTSNMFKIFATGTVTITVANEATDQTDTILTAQSALDDPPICIAAVSGSNDEEGNVRQLGREFNAFQPTAWVASQLNGSAVMRATVPLWEASLGSFLQAGSGKPAVRIGMSNHSAASATAYGRYYLCQETAL